MANLVEVKVPDIGDFTDIPVIEILVKAGDTVKKEDSLISLESDKATMEVPSTHRGSSRNSRSRWATRCRWAAWCWCWRQADGGGADSRHRADSWQPSLLPRATAAKADVAPVAAPAAPKAAPAVAPSPTPASASTEQGVVTASVHASPSIRAFAREFGVDLTKVKGTGNKGRINEEDVQGFVKSRIGQAGRRCDAGRWRILIPDNAAGRFQQVWCDRDARRCRASRNFPATTSPATG